MFVSSSRGGLWVQHIMAQHDTSLPGIDGCCILGTSRELGGSRRRLLARHRCGLGSARGARQGFCDLVCTGRRTFLLSHRFLQNGLQPQQQPLHVRLYRATPSSQAGFQKDTAVLQGTPQALWLGQLLWAGGCRQLLHKAARRFGQGDLALHHGLQHLRHGLLVRQAIAEQLGQR